MINLESLRSTMVFGIDMKNLIKTIILLTLLIGSFSYAVTVLGYQYVNKLRDKNEADLNAIVLSCKGSELSEFKLPKFETTNELGRKRMFAEGGWPDWKKIRDNYGKNVEFIVRITDNSVLVNGLNLIDKSHIDQIRNRNVFNFKGYSNDYSFVQFSTSIPSLSTPDLRYGHHFEGGIDRYTGELSITTHNNRSKTDEKYYTKAVCTKLEKLF